MAQTIQIKNGTGSSAPATLAQGELAINVSSGSMWYGSGSSATTHSNFMFGEITASNRMLNQYGNHTGTGNITASGTITSLASTTTTLTVGGRLYASLGEGTSNSVVVNSGGQLAVDEIDAGVWGAAGNVVTSAGSVTAPTATLASTASTSTLVATTDNTEFFVTLADGASGAQALETSAKLKQNPSTGKLTITGDVSASSTVTSSGLHIGADKGIAVNTVKAGQGLTRIDSNVYAYFTHYEYGQDASVSGSFVGAGNAGNNHQYNSEALGTFNHDSTSDAAGGIEIGVSQVTMSSAQYIHPCYTVPFDCELVGFTGTLHRFGGNHMMSAGLFVAATQFDSNAATKMTLRAFATASRSPSGDNSYNQKNNHWEDLSQTYALSAGDKVWAGVHCGTETGDSLRAQLTIVFRHKLGLE